MSLFALSGRVALVTGASSGFGMRFAHVLAAAGARVVVAARRVDRLQALVAELSAAGSEVIAVAMDVTDEGSVIAGFDAAEHAFGTVDTIIANAGVNVDGTAIDLSVDAFDEIVAVNLRGVFLTAREGAKRMIAANVAQDERGRIVVISSITAHKVDAGLAPYSATKAGVVQMGKVLARDWIRRGISVNMICPGYARTEINADWFDSEAGRRHAAAFPRRRLMDEAALDAPLLFFCSDAARYVTGAVLTVDDGQSL